MKLYFQHSNKEQEYICEVSNNNYVGKALDDLYKRNPKYQSYYQRTWTDENGWIWIDFGSWSQFYIVKPE